MRNAFLLVLFSIAITALGMWELNKKHLRGFTGKDVGPEAVLQSLYGYDSEEFVASIASSQNTKAGYKDRRRGDTRKSNKRADGNLNGFDKVQLRELIDELLQ